MDGVLVDSGEAHYQAWHRMGEELGVPYPRELFNRTFGMHNRQTIPMWLGHAVDTTRLLELADRKEVYYREVAHKTLHAIPGAVTLVRALVAAGYKLAVGTSGPRANALLSLEILKIRECFTALSTGDDVKNGKPSPDIFLFAAEQLDIPAKNIMVIEDAPPGIEAAHAAGMRVIAIPTSRPASELSAADLVANSLIEVRPETVGQLLSV